jgi:hypothetical protein
VPVEPTDPVSRLAAPISTAPSVRTAKVEHRPSPRVTSPPRPLPVVARPPRPANNLITAVLIIIGIWNTVESIPSYLDFESVLSQALAAAGYGTVALGSLAHTTGIVLLAVSCVLLLATIGVSLRLIQLGRRSIWVPVVAALVFVVSSLIAMTVVVANTPAVLVVLQNQ